MPTDSENDYQQKKLKLAEDFRALNADSAQGNIGLGKSSSNLFRLREDKNKRKIDVRNFNHVITIDQKNLTADVEGMTRYEDFVHETLKYNLLPTVVPELKSITVGGAATGVGIESSSFRYGFVHETVLAMEILLGDGRVVFCTPENEHKDLFFAFPNSYGTLGYALRLKIKLIPAKRYVHLIHTKFENPKDYFSAMKKICTEARDGKKALDYIDGVVFGPGEMVLTEAHFCDEAPQLSNYKFMNIYYQSLRTKKEDYLTAHDYIWRWDTDWFWCSRAFKMQNPVMRFLFGKFALRSTFYWKIKHWADRIRLVQRLEKLRGVKSESIIQDVEIPIEHAGEFLAFFQKEIGIKPVWTCPARAYNPNVHFDIFPADPQQLYVNFGFWDAILTTHSDGYHNRLIEKKVRALNGKKSLYSTSFYSPEEFDELYHQARFHELKQKYDPRHVFKNLYEKCVDRK